MLQVGISITEKQVLQLNLVFWIAVAKYLRIMAGCVIQLFPPPFKEGQRKVCSHS